MIEGRSPVQLIRAVLFDFDGTLTVPGSLDFHKIRETIGCPEGVPVLEFIHGMVEPVCRLQALRTLDAFEADAARESIPNEGAEELLEWLVGRGLKAGIISRNSRAAIESALRSFGRFRASDFAVILSRDDPFPPKPSPDGILAAASMMAIAPDELLVVGDYVFDIEAGRRAGALTAFLTNRRSSSPSAIAPDFTLGRLEDLKKILDFHAPLPPGKLPNEWLGSFLARFAPAKSALLIPPRVGEDAAAIALSGEEVLVLKTDPITFASDACGRYAVTVNVNDIAAIGARAQWLLVTLLFPVGVNAAQIELVMKELYEKACAEGLLICGGHTEITDAVTRPVVTVQVAGTAAKENLILKERIEEGDLVLLTKRLAVEGTSLIARELAGRLHDLGLDERIIDRSRSFLVDPGISVVAEAQIAAGVRGVSAMHDVTEGGLSTALYELSSAGGHRIRVHKDRIPIYQETESLCRLLGLDPLGLIGSGSLLIACRVEAAQKLISALQEAGIETTCLGEVRDRGIGIDAVDADGSATQWPRFAVDEIARLLAKS